MKKLFFFSFLLCLSLFGVAQTGKTENVIIVTLDGMRWQEVFNGVDAALMNDSIFNRDRDGIKAKFRAEIV